MKRIIFTLIVIVLGVGGYFYYTSHRVIQVTNTQTSASAGTEDAVLDETIRELSAFIVLPENDTPILAVVSDPKALAGETFFAHAEVGDRVLIYKQSRKAILYRPSIKKIIEMESIPADALSPSTTTNG